MAPAVATRPDLRLRIRDLIAVFAAELAVILVGTLVVLAVAGTQRRDHLLFSPATSAYGLAAYAALVGGTLWAAARTPDRRLALGLVRPASWRRALGAAVLALFASYLADLLLEPLLHGARSQGLAPARFPGGVQASIGLGLAFLTVAVVAPIAEELYFRGAWFAALRMRAGLVPTVLLTALGFAAAHGEPRALPQLAVLGVILALLYERTGSIVPGIAVHAANNAISLLVLLAF